MFSASAANVPSFILQTSEGESDVPVDLLHWLIALSPIIVLLVLLAVFGWKAPEAGPIGMFIGAGTALFVFQTPVETLTVSIGAGVWDSVFVLYVVWGALLLYRAADTAGALVSLRQGIEKFSKNQVFLVLAFGWVFASFLQGIAGFGVPIAVVAPILVALGVTPVLAVVIPLIGHAWANLFGTLGVGWLATLQVVEVDDETLTAFLTATLLWVVNLLGGMTVAWLFGRWSAVWHTLPLVLIISAIHGGGQLALVFWDPILSAFFATTIALCALYPLSRWKLYREKAEDVEDRPAATEGNDTDAETDAQPPMSFLWSLLPYGVLTAAAGLLAVPFVRDTLEVVSVGLPFPDTETGFGVANEIADDVYSPFTPFTHPGFFVVVAGVVTIIVYRMKGFYAEWAKRTEKQSLWRAVTGDAIPGH